ncbi:MULTISPECIES: hypothetical protein [Sphingobacterium]|uniref:Uncharacterized protein n=1 Tax=Sphingobacterium hotanense TaxID=649196 RepID=A0ABT7NLE8_9SPHI|nr:MULTISPECIES: hypothetical protein [Sphingobacterium]MDM1048017.1 hypothetical protein [Sphingobacterium hotanense]
MKQQIFTLLGSIFFLYSGQANAQPNETSPFRESYQMTFVDDTNKIIQPLRKSYHRPFEIAP